MLTVCHLAEKAQNINRNTENYDHKRGITSTKLASKERLLVVLATDATVGDLSFDASFVLVMPRLWS